MSENREFKLNQQVWWFVTKKDGILLDSGYIRALHFGRAKLKKKIFCYIGWDERNIDLDSLFHSKDEAIDSMIARLENLRETLND